MVVNGEVVLHRDRHQFKTTTLSCGLVTSPIIHYLGYLPQLMRELHNMYRIMLETRRLLLEVCRFATPGTTQICVVRYPALFFSTLFRSGLPGDVQI